MKRGLGFLMGDDDIPMLSGMEALILELLADRGEMFGLQLVAESQGVLKRGTVYTTLSRMREKGYVTSRQESQPSGGLPLRLYSMTTHGRDVFRLYEEMAATAMLRFA